jgi:hypothetical protein
VKLRNLTRDLEQTGPYDPFAITRKEARQRANAWYIGQGRKQAPGRFLTATEKMQHSDGVAVGISLRPSGASGVNVCTAATAGCIAACVLETSARGKWANVRDGRTLRTLFLQADPQAFLSLVAYELQALVKKHGRVAFRPNVASDLRYEYICPALFSIPGVAGYDYTKLNPLKHRGQLANYRLTYSVSELGVSEVIGAAWVAAGGTSAVVTRTPKHDQPATWRGQPAIDGDLTDDRTTDPSGVYVLLAAKADGKADATGFVKTLEVVAA